MVLFSPVLFTCTPSSTQPCIPQRAMKGWGFSCCTFGGKWGFSPANYCHEPSFPMARTGLQLGPVPGTPRPGARSAWGWAEAPRAGAWAGLRAWDHCTQLQHISACQPQQHCRNISSLQVKHTMSRLLTLLLGSKVNSCGTEFNVCFKEGWKTATTEKNPNKHNFNFNLTKKNNPVWSQMGAVGCLFSYFFVYQPHVYS